MQMSVKIGFRVDANEHIATGHLMRCIAIAKACENLGLKCKFYLAENKMTSKLDDNNLPYDILYTEWDRLHKEIPVMTELIKREQLQWLIVDSYQADAYYLTSLNKACRVMYIDDFTEKPYDIAAVLHYNYVKNDTEFEKLYKNTGTMVLAGSDYVPLRREFQKKIPVQREQAILITTGGTDPYMITQRILEHKNEYIKLRQYTFHVILGSMNQSVKKLELLAKGDSKIILHQNVNNMSDYMRKCECAVSAGGTTLYELCACETPTVCFSFADNQKQFVKSMGRDGIMISAGDVRENNQIEKNILSAITELTEREELRNRFVEKMRNLIDGLGTVRIAKALSEADIR